MSEKKGIFATKLSLGKNKSGKTKYPEKGYINLVQKEKGSNVPLSIGLFVLFLIVLAIFTRFAVMGPLDKISRAANEYNTVLRQVNAVKESNKEYDSVKLSYDSVTDWYMTEDEKAVVDKTNVFRMLEEDLMPFVKLSNINISGKTITIQTYVTTLQTVSEFLSKLQADPRNEFVTVRTASANKSNPDAGKNDVVASIVITYGGAKGEN